MRKKNIEKIEKAIEYIGKLNNKKIIKEISWSWNPFCESYRYFDHSKREEYKAKIIRNKYIIVRVLPKKIGKAQDFNGKKEYLIVGEKVYRKTDMEIVSNFVLEFFKKRNFILDNVVLKIKNEKRIEIIVDNHIAEIEVIRTKPNFEFILKDKESERPYFCSPNHQYIFKIKSHIEGWGNEEVLINYEENEIATTTLSPIALIRKSIYGFGSYNLRGFYSDEGLFPEVKHGIKQVVYGNLAGSIVGASVFVRVAEKLKDNTWYTLASGILAFIRAPAEVYFMKKSLKLTEKFPSSLVQKFFEKGKIKEIYESKEIRVWRNFEREIFNIFKNKEDFIYLAEKYSNLKFQIYKLVKNNKIEEIYSLLKDDLNISSEELEKLKYFVIHLKTLDVDRIVQDIKKEINGLYEKKILKIGGEYMFFKYIDEIFKENLIRLPVNKAFKYLNDRLKDEERDPTKEEISNFISISKRRIEPFRFLDLFTFFSLFVMGYFATFFKGLKDISILIYYIFYGAISNIIVAAVNRYGGQVGLQYLFKGLENAPNVTSAADAWNEYNSHIMRLWAVFSSLGMVIGILGKVFSNITNGFSRYFIEGLALILYIMAIREWFLYYQNLEQRSKIGE
ncbi:MAG: hypothetical protein NC827_01455 [Candidatus Omnitrophica bacterium]|nr:hypothetical protein [Candidatus Omnitrophota bacterium]MCM8801966.1 hypothetical protein [Candidatus Omnitrophota bacterium]